VYVVDRRGLRVHDVGLGRQVVRRRPVLAGQQHRGGSVRQRGRVPGGHRPVLAAEYGLQLGQLLNAAVSAQVLIALEAQERGDQVVEDPVS
jgi:hypothetical protein